MKRDIMIVTILLVLLYCIILPFVLLFFGDITIHTIFFSIYIAILGVFAIGNIRAKMLGLPTEDELSKKIKEKAAAYSFYSSMVLWVVIVLINDIMKLNPRELMGVGVYCMAILFGFF